MSEQCVFGLMTAMALVGGIGSIIGGLLARQYYADNRELRELLEWWRKEAGDKAQLAMDRAADLIALKGKLAKVKDEFDAI